MDRRKHPDPDFATVRQVMSNATVTKVVDWSKSTKADPADPFVPAQAHADAVVVQLAAALDAFACAVAHYGQLANRDRASFDNWNASLVEAAGGEVGERIGVIRNGEDYRGLIVYRHLAAHRGILGALQRGRSREEDGRDEVRIMLPEWLPVDTPDNPLSTVRPILERYVTWGRPTIDELRESAIVEWNLEDDSRIVRPFEREEN